MKENEMLTYDEFITRYLNKRNPATGLFWLLADIADDSGAPVSLITEYRNRAIDEQVDVIVDISDDIDYHGIDEDEIAIIPCGGRGQPSCDEIIDDDDFADDYDDYGEIIAGSKNKGMLYLGLAALAFVMLKK